jgi:hypothetical protein
VTAQLAEDPNVRQTLAKGGTSQGPAPRVAPRRSRAAYLGAELAR